MAKDVERKRKLEQEQADNATAKRVKQSQKSSVKANGASSGTSAATPKQNGGATTKLSTETLGTSSKDKEIAQRAVKDEVETTPSAKKAKTRKSLQNGEGAASVTNSKVDQVDAGADVSMVDAGATQPESKKSRKQKKRQELIKAEEAEAEAGADHRSGSGAVITTRDKSQRALEKKARRKAEREIKAGLKDDDALTAPNENGWWLSPPSAGRYLEHDPIFVTDENDDECLIAATVREVQLLHVDNSLISRTHAVPDGRSILAYTLSAEYPDHVEIAYDNGAKVQWNWTTGSVINGSFPGNETTIATTIASLPDGRPEVYYISQAQGTYTIVDERRALYTTYRRLSSIKVLEGGAYIICLGTTAMVLGKRKALGEAADYIWIEMPTTVPFQCLDARLMVPFSAKGGSSAKQQKGVTPDLALAVGNADGQIHFYSGLSSLFAKPSEATLPMPRILHWHREAVSAVKFSRDGNYLISGGRESVLVIWQLETGHKQFLPHLTAEIERIVVSPKGTQYALQMGDNSIMVLSTTELKPVANFAGLQLPVMNEQLQLQDMVTPATTAILHPGKPQQLLLTVPATQPKYASDITTRPFLQSFDTQNARHINRQALSRNNVTDFNRGPENTPVIPPDVNLLSASADGKWLATVDEWFPPATDLEHAVSRTSNLDNIDLANIQEEQLKRREVYLKFWSWDESQSMWTLSTRADAPHARTSNADLGSGAGRILQLRSDPASDGFATVGEDGEVKIWKPKTKVRNGVPLKEPNGKDLVEWACRKTIKLPIATDLDERADSPMEGVAEQDKPLAAIDACLAYSPDGSILACTTISADVTAQPLVYFINPATGMITSTKSGIIPADEDVQDFGFLDRYFIVLSLGQVRVWNLVDDSVHYTITLSGQAEEQENARLAINTLDETFAITSTLGLSMEIDVPVPQITVYTPVMPEALFEAELESNPVALLTGKHTKGYTIVFEDGTIRTLTSAQASSTYARRHSLAASEISETVEAERAITEDAETASSSALALLSNKAEDEEMADNLAPLLLTGDGEDDRPVVRPEQLTSIFDVGQGVAVAPVRDMFRDVVGLFARKPRARADVMML
ncbi:putative WD40/YVTN repeat-like-containing domain superfamily [Septoria linicola]|nr:putative WD40/YVTN repeat-like-containing domain superfamily [Septoria linicola]